MSKDTQTSGQDLSFTVKSLGKLYRGHWVSISGTDISISGKLLGGVHAAAARAGSGLWERYTAT